MPDDLACQELVEIITHYLEGILPASERRRFEAHLSECDGCTTYLEQMRQTINLTRGLAAETLSPGDREMLLRLFRDWKANDRG